MLKKIKNQTIKEIQPKKPKKKKVKSRSKLIKELDTAYSQYIRLKDSIKGIATCVTCGAKANYKLLQNGHRITRGNYKYRRSDDNCHVQCMRCNIFLSGNYKAYTLFMIKKYGLEFVEERNNEINWITDIKNYELEEKIEFYKEKVKELLKLV